VEKAQNITDIFTNTIDIFENSIDISTNFNDILTFVCALGGFCPHTRRVEKAVSTALD